MTTVPMPEPVTCWLDKTDFINKPCVTTTQAEAYADARVRGALEEAAKICWEMQSAPEFGKDDKDRWLAIAESRIRSMIKE